MTSLYLEVVASIVVAAVFSLLIGWFMRGASAKRRLTGTIEEWERKTEELKQQHASEVDELETSLQSAAATVRQLTADNRQLKARGENAVDADRARSDAIELNRKQAKLQDRLQRIIRQKDREIAVLTEKAIATAAAPSPQALEGRPSADPVLSKAPTPEPKEIESYIDKHAHIGASPHKAQQTLDQPPQAVSDLADSTADDDFDATTLLETSSLVSEYGNEDADADSATLANTVALDDTDQHEHTLDDEDPLDQTDIVMFESTEEATIALDEDMLNDVRKRHQTVD